MTSDSKDTGIFGSFGETDSSGSVTFYPDSAQSPLKRTLDFNPEVYWRNHFNKKTEEMNNDLNDLKRRVVPEESYFRVANNLNSLAFFVILISPIAIVLSILNIIPQYSDKQIINYIAAAAVAGSFAYVVYAYQKIHSIDTDLQKIDKRLNDLEQCQND